MEPLRDDMWVGVERKSECVPVYLPPSSIRLLKDLNSRMKLNFSLHISRRFDFSNSLILSSWTESRTIRIHEM